MTPLGIVGLTRSAIKTVIQENVDLILETASSIHKDERGSFLNDEEQKLIRNQIGFEIGFLNNNYGTIGDTP